MSAKRKIPAMALVGEISGGRLSDPMLMKKYGLDHRQYVFVLGKLAEKRKISFKKVLAAVRGFLNEGRIDEAEASLDVIKKHFSGIWGVQSAAKGLEQDLLEARTRMESLRNKVHKSDSLVWFDFEYPGSTLHPSVETMVQILDNHTEKLLAGMPETGPDPSVFDARSRLALYPRHIHFFDKCAPVDATRMWHYISLELFMQKGFENYIVKGMMDAATCDVCMHIDGTRLPTAEVLEIERDLIEKFGKMPPLKKFPSSMSIEDLSSEQRAGALIVNGWHLPPFCENCRCQIFPCL